MKNTLATVQAMAALSFKEIGAETRPSLDAFQARLLALSKAHNLLNETNWTGASLADLVRTELAFGADLRRVTTDGPDVHLNHVQFESGSSRWVGEAARIPI